METELELVRWFEPVLRLAQGEMFHPVAVEDYLRSARLVVAEDAGTRVLAGAGELDPGRLAALGRSHRGEALELLYVAAPLDRRAYRDWVQGGHRPTFARSSAAARVGLIARFLAALARLSLLLRGRVPGGHAAAAALQAASAAGECTYYARVTRDAGYIAIQYWFLYPMNDWRSSFGGVNDHEADWEQITVFLDDAPGGPTPAWVAFSSHDEVGADLRRRWDDPDLAKVGDHPVVNVGAGSHSGAYLPGEYLVGIAPRLPGWMERLRRGLLRILPWADPSGQIGIPYIDYRRGDGLSIGPGGDRQWHACLIDDATPWVMDYAGLWGLDTHDPLGGERAPAGPRYERDGRVRPSWSQPIAWADLDREPPASTRQHVWSSRRDVLARQLQDVDRDLEEARAAWRSATVAGQAADPALRPTRAELTSAAAQVRALRQHHSRLTGQLMELDRTDPMTPPLAQVHAHLTQRAMPLARQASDGVLLRIWSSASAVLMLLAAGLLLLDGSSALLVPLLGLIVVMLAVEAILRGRLLSLLVRVGLAVALGVGVLLVADLAIGHWRQVLGALLVLGAAVLTLQALTQAARERTRSG